MSAVIPENSCWFKSVQDVTNVSQELHHSVQPVIGFSFHSSVVEDVDHKALPGAGCH